MLSRQAERLRAAVTTASPGAEVSIGVPGVSASVRIDFPPAATDQQRVSAQSAVDSFDWSDAAQAAWEADQFPERKDLRAAAAAAIADNDTFLALASPTNAQVLAQVRKLTQQNTRIIRRLSQID